MTVAALLAVAAVALAGATAGTAARAAEPLPGLDGFFDRWGELHGDYDPRVNRWVRGWLGLIYRLGAPLARRGVQPHALTLWSVWLALAVVVLAFEGGRWPLLAGVLVVASATADALDGCVAVLTRRVTRWGHVLDALADRVSDVAYLLSVWLVGAPGWLAVATGVAFGLLEYARAGVAGAGLSHIVVVTVGERPVRVLCCTAALLSAGAAPSHARALAAAWLAALAVLSLAGLGQLLRAARRVLC